MNDTETVEQLLATGLSDDTRDIGGEMVAALENVYKNGKSPDDNTRLAAMALYSMAHHTIVSMLALDLAGILDEATGESVKLEDGELPESLDNMLRAGAFVVAMARDEEKDAPQDMAMVLVRAMFDADVKNKYSKLALDNIRKGKYLS
jgi:hypothetical protein